MREEDLIDVVLIISFSLLALWGFSSNSIILNYLVGPLSLIYMSFGLYSIWENNT